MRAAPRPRVQPSRPPELGGLVASTVAQRRPVVATPHEPHRRGPDHHLLPVSNVKKKPNLILLSLFWSLLLAFVMTLIGFLHQTPTDLTDAAGGGVSWSRVLFLFFGWFVFAEIVMLVGGLIYILKARLRGGSRG